MNFDKYNDESFYEPFEELDKSLSKRVAIGFAILFMSFVLLLIIGLSYKYIQTNE